jgi:signal transduction histidine kinase
VTRFSFGAWLVFGAVAALPASGATVVAWRLRASALAQARVDEAARLTAAGESAQREIEGWISNAKDRVRAMSELEGLNIRGADSVVLDADGRLRGLAPEAPVTPACDRARTGLLGVSRSAYRDEILERCEDVRSSSGRYLWPLLALETPAGQRELPSWLGTHAARLGPDERDVIAARLGTLEPAERARCTAALATPPSPSVVLDKLLTQGSDQVDGTLRVRTGKYVALLHAEGGAAAGCAFHAASILRDPPMLPSDLALASGSGAASVTVAPELRLHVEPKSEAKEDALLERGPDRAFATMLAGTISTLLLAAVVYGRFLHARKLAELRTDFVAAVSHELRTPLASVQLLAELLEGGAVEASERAEVERTLAREAQRLSTTLNQMLRFGALSRGKLQPERRRQPLAPVVRAAVQRFAQAQPGKAIDLDLDEAVEADIDGALFGLVLDNLLGNAAKYAAEGGPYRVSASRRGEFVRLSVADRGPGLDRAAKARVFLPFERADDRLVRATEGTGVGLALVRGIAEAHGGRARVESEVGRGATFIVEVPWKPS